ncbi:hypothetical protein N7462_008777 [Penicillium macrosclerotiorum]|uniref:uncharacterized protein n=1 Tax=Penicillium macrosclerotiorum TaxID=303699 RepID=UPI002548CA32|nr:uncharacterized protein N7462_008777 [Penicillium macrosclerotiorum]KAJ5675880.1 hypothetical protein N7462_008777 [Penicillium macrosclerotiorum]
MARNDERSQHGKKRPAEGDPDGAQPLTKRFGRLQIDNEPVVARAQRDVLPAAGPPPQSDMMLLDDTRYTTYIHDLDQELAESDASPDHLVLLPLAQRMISPNATLSTSSQGKELVLYTEPSSLTVSKEQDSVRKAIIESRSRARAERASSIIQSTDQSIACPGEHVMAIVRPSSDDPSEDVMDIDLS